MRKLPIHILSGFAVFLLTVSVFAETIEMVTYYPTSGGGGAEDPQFDTVRVGYPATAAPADGIVNIATALTIGVPAPGGGAAIVPNQQLEITGNFQLPATAAAGGVPSAGVIFAGTTPYIHNFGGANFFAGEDAGNFTMTGNENTGIGVNVLNSNFNGVQNTAMGFDTLSRNTSGQRNAAFGNESMRENVGGGFNTGMGHNTLFFNVNGFNNTAVGYQALLNTTGNDNVAVGQNAGSNLLANANTTGSGNTFIGTRSGSGVAAQLTNATAIGYEALVSASNALVLGGTGANAVSVGIGTETPQATLDVVNDGGAILVPRKSTAGDPAVGINGMIYYNANANRFRIFQNGGWVDMNGAPQQVIVKANDQTINTLNATFTTDTDLAFAVGANQTWQFEFFAIVTLPSNSGMVLRLQGPAIGTGWLRANSLVVGGNDSAYGFSDETDRQFVRTFNAYADTQSVSYGNNYVARVEVNGTIRTGATAGNVTIQWTRRINGTNIVVRRGSYVKATRVA
jgi:hypothetical protein